MKNNQKDKKLALQSTSRRSGVVEAWRAFAFGEEFISLHHARGMIIKPYGACDVKKEFENLRYPV